MLRTHFYGQTVGVIVPKDPQEHFLNGNVNPSGFLLLFGDRFSLHFNLAVYYTLLEIIVSRNNAKSKNCSLSYSFLSSEH